MTSKRVHIFTCAQNGATPHWNFLKGLETLAAQNGTIVKVGVTNGRDPTSRRGKDKDDKERLNPYFRENTEVLFEGQDLTGGKKKLKINSNIYARNFPVKAQQMIPTTSWDRFVSANKSAIMFAPKIMLECQANLGDLPKILTSTGAVTRPHYKDNSWGVKAELDHTLGAIIVEVENDKIFHFRQLVPDTRGVFYDLGVKYDGEKTPVQERIDALIPGDWHSGLTDPTVRATTYEMIKKLRPRNIVIHDLSNILQTHHVKDDLIYQSLLALLGRGNIHKNFEMCRMDLAKFLKVGEEDMGIIVSRGNHDNHPVRYLQQGRFTTDPINYLFAQHLNIEEHAGRNCLEEGMRYTLKKLEDNPADIRKSKIEFEKSLPPLERVYFVGPSESYKLHGIEVGCHGDLGANGSRGSIRTVSKNLGNCFVGHSHTPGIFRGAWQVGTSTYLRLGYNQGPSSWLNTHGIINPNGKRQLVNIINGKYRA